MADSLKKIIEHIKNSSSVQSNIELVDWFSLINKYSDNEKEKAYFLGLFFKKKSNSELLTPENKKKLLGVIKFNNLEDYYYLKTKPEKEPIKILSILFFTGGFILMIIGAIRLFKGEIIVTTSLRYLATMVKNGGYQLILGIVLFTGGFIRYRYEQNKQKFRGQLA